MTATDDDWKAQFDALPVGPAPELSDAETVEQIAQRLVAEGRAEVRRIRDDTDPATNAGLERRIRRAIAEAGGDPDRWTEWDPWAPGEGPVDPDRHPLADYLIEWSEFWDADLDEQEWLLEPLFAQRRAHALYAGAKSGKSYVVLAACAALATGRPFLDKPAGEPVDVLYCDFEMTLEDLRDRLTEFGYGPDDDLSHLHYALLPSLPPLDTEAGGIALRDAAVAVDAKLVVIDTTSRVIEGDENDADTMRAFYRFTGLLLKQALIAWVRLDHSGKDAAKGQRGSSAKNDDVDVVIRLERTEAGVKLTATHRRMSWFPEETSVTIAEEQGTVTFLMPLAATGGGWPAGTKDVADNLERLGAPLDISQRAAVALLQEHGFGARREKVKAALKHRRQRAEAAVENLDQSASATRGRAVEPERVRESGTRVGRGRDESENPAPLLGSAASGDLGRARTHLDADRARTRASHVVDAPAGPRRAQSTGDDDEDIFG